MTAALSLNQLARMSAERMLNGMLEGIAIGLFAWVVLQLMGRRNSSTRFAVWFSALLAIAALPVLGIATSSARAGSVGSAVTLPTSWALAIFFVWAGVAGVALLRVGVGLLQLRKLRASCTAIDAAALDPILRATVQGFQAVRSVAVCQSDRVQVPTAIGFLKPVVVIPAWALQELSTAELNSILIHELAHLRRWDDWTNLAQKIVKALFFFHPAVWWIENRLALEREMACDDMVLARTANPKAYAACLIAFAEKVQRGRELALAQAAVSHIRQTSLRISQILDVRRPNATRVWKPVLGVITGLSVAAFIAAPYVPRVIAFQDRAQPAPALASMSSVSAVRSVLASSIGQASMSRRNIRTADPAIEAVPVRFEPRASASSVRGEFITSRKLRPRLAQASGRNQIPAMLVIMQSAQYDASGSAVWTICVWRVRAGSSVQDQIETAIVLSSI